MHTSLSAHNYYYNYYTSTTAYTLMLQMCYLEYFGKLRKSLIRLRHSVLSQEDEGTNVR